MVDQFASFPALKAAWGPDPLPVPLHVKYCEETALALFRLRCLNAQQPAPPAPSGRCLPRNTASSFQIPRSSPPMIHPGCTYPRREGFLKNLPLDFNPVLALGFIGIVRKSATELLGALNPPRKTKNEILWVQCSSACLQCLFFFLFNEFKDCVQRVNVISI